MKGRETASLNFMEVQYDMTTNKKLTLQDLITAKLKKDKDKDKKEEFYVDSLGGTVTIEMPDEDVLIRAMDMLQEQSMGSILESYKYLIYNCVPIFRSTELHQECDVQDPIDIVAKLLEINERLAMGEVITRMSNMNQLDSDIKN